MQGLNTRTGTGSRTFRTTVCTLDSRVEGFPYFDNLMLTCPVKGGVNILNPSALLLLNRSKDCRLF